MYVREIHIAFGCALVPAEHAIESRVELIVIPLVNAAGVDPEVAHIVLRSSFLTETEFGVTSLILALASDQLILCDFSAFRPCVGQYRIGRNFISEVAQIEVAA